LLTDEPLTAGAVGGLVASIATCPLDVIKTKLQAQRATHGQADYLGISGLCSVFLLLLTSPNLILDAPPPLSCFFFFFCGSPLAVCHVLQRLFATSSGTTVFEGFIVVSGRPSSAIFQPGPSTLPCTTGSRPVSASCLLASTHPSQNQNGSIPRRPPRVTSPSSVSIDGRSTCCLQWSPVRRAPSVPFRSGSSKPASWYAITLFLPSPFGVPFPFFFGFVLLSLTYGWMINFWFWGCTRWVRGFSY
jgi:Mitochondrial carrier protein